MEPKAAAAVLRAKIADPKKPMTVADATVASGLSTRDTEGGLSQLTSEFRGHLRVTEDGDLVHVFPNGFTKPWETEDPVGRFFGKLGRGLLGIGRFVIRAWLLIAMIGYALLFVALIIGLTFARTGSNNRSGAQFLAFFFRMIADAMFWTLHPFSPAYVGADWMEAREEQKEELPFYEKVNRFVFGPPPEKTDEHAMRARILAEIRGQKGRIGLADVMRVTGLPRDEADPLMARLMMEHDGEVDVAEQGGIVYRFEKLRLSFESKSARPEPAWSAMRSLPALIGNSGASNIAIGALNALNLGGSLYALTHSLTIANIALLMKYRFVPEELWQPGTPIVLGVVPLVFSSLIFAAPIIRAIARAGAQKKILHENARLSILREVLARAPRKEPVTDETLRHAWRVATGDEPTSAQITARVVELGGDVDTEAATEDAPIRYRFADLEADEEALEEERRNAEEAEAKVGRIVFASDDKL